MAFKRQAEYLVEGQRLATIRQINARISQVNFARLMGVSAVTVWRWENGIYLPPPSAYVILHAIILLRRYGCPNPTEELAALVSQRTPFPLRRGL